MNLYRAILFNKPARHGTPLPWHQDAGKMWGLDRDPEVQLWTALDDTTLENGCLEVLPGSHHFGLAGPLGGLVPAEEVRRREADAQAVALPVCAGEAILLHNVCWHRSGPNPTGQPRRAVSVCYLPASARCLRRRHAPRSFFRVFD